MNALSLVFVFKIVATVVVWCGPLILMPSRELVALGFDEPVPQMLVRMLGWAYLALCVGYGFGLRASLRGERAMGPIWVGIVSNGGACVFLTVYGVSGAWSHLDDLIQLVGWGSAVATFGITLGLVMFGVRGAGTTASATA